MIYPILAYGYPILRKIAKDIDKDYPILDKLIDEMFENMYHSNGVGLAAPQIGLSIRLFVIDASPFAEFDDLEDGEREQLIDKRVFINAHILEETGEEWDFNEGCLSVPGINEDVTRYETIKIEYYDTDFNKKTEVFSGILARVIQHEYDHLDGILFTDHLSNFKKRILKRKLENISKGKVNIDYRMKFPKKK
jgi:peptide deformylase